MGMGLPFQVAVSVTSFLCSVLVGSDDVTVKDTSPLASSGVMVETSLSLLMDSLGGVLSTENVRVSGLEAVPPGAVATAVTVCVKLSAKLPMSMF